MGLRQLEWHEGKNGAWVARVKYSNDKYRRFAHVNIYEWDVKRNGRRAVPVQFQFYTHGYEVTWHDSIEAAKLHVEAIFALDND
jgi:hypothetical protein